MRLQDIITELERNFPPQLQESYDNAGFQVRCEADDISRCLVTLDVTEQVVDEAVMNGCQLIIAHHPLIFGRGLMRIGCQGPVERTIQKAIQHQISIYCAHTNADAMPQGTSKVMMEKIGISDFSVLLPAADGKGNYGSGAIGCLPSEEDSMHFLQRIKEAFGCGSIRHTDIVCPKIKKVAVCSGSGSFLLQEAIRQGAQVFVSGDFTYHKYFEADGRIIIADLGHFETENGIKDVFVDILTKKFINFAVLKSNINTNPIIYL